MLNMSVIFNTDWGIDNAQPLPPNCVAAGTITAKPAKALPPDLDSFVSTADVGVVFASLGTTAVPGKQSDVAVLVCF